jgi:hypothetical protein
MAIGSTQSSNSVHDGANCTMSGGESAPAILTCAAEHRIFDPTSNRDWLELIRDIAAVANSGGGEIAVRVAGGGQAVDVEGPAAQVALSSREIVDRLAQYTDSGFDDIRLRARESDASGVVIAVGRALAPIVFTKAGYEIDAADPSTRVEVFPAGSFYTRHEGRIEPGTSADLRAMLEQLLRRVRRRWVAGIRRVITQPVDYSVRRRRQDKDSRKKTDGARAVLKPVRIVADPSAPALQPQDVDRLYPLRQKDLLRELNHRLGRRTLNSYDIQAIRRQHRLDERPEFVFHLPGAGRRYSPVVIEWILEQRERNPVFFQEARARDHELMKLRRQKPR